MKNVKDRTASLSQSTAAVELSTRNGYCEHPTTRERFAIEQPADKNQCVRSGLARSHSNNTVIAAIADALWIR